MAETKTYDVWLNLSGKKRILTEIVSYTKDGAWILFVRENGKEILIYGENVTLIEEV